MALKIDLGISPTFLYIFTGPVLGVLEKAFTFIPSNIILSKIIPYGVEGTMMSLYGTILTMSMFAVKNWMGIIINDLFINCSKNNLSNFYKQISVSLFGSFIPFLFIWYMIPKKIQIE